MYNRKEHLNSRWHATCSSWNRQYTCKSNRPIIRVLHVPNLLVSLVSDQRIAKLDEFGIIFKDTDALLCNMVHGWRIDLAKVHHGLSYSPSMPSNNERSPYFKAAAQSSTSEEEKVILLHR